MRTLITILIATLLALQYKLWLGNDGVFSNYKLKKKIIAQNNINNNLRQKNQQLRCELQDLKNSDALIEEKARFEFGMIKKDEQYYQFYD